VRRLGLVLALALAGRAQALEPRFDHRDQQGLQLALETWQETVAVQGHGTTSQLHPRLRLGWSFDVSGEGDELVLGVGTRLDGWDDPGRTSYLAGVDGRYRGFFGTEELKTFFEVGVFSEIRSRWIIGPLVGLGASYDPSRTWGLFVSAGFQAGLGEARTAAFGGSIGAQLRFD
jgi:hypothetical protein